MSLLFPRGCLTCCWERYSPNEIELALLASSLIDATELAGEGRCMADVVEADVEVVVEELVVGCSGIVGLLLLVGLVVG